MENKELKARRYWIFKDPVTEAHGRIRIAPAIQKRHRMGAWFIEAGDIGYFYDPEDGRGVWGWCVAGDTPPREGEGGFLSFVASDYTVLGDGVSEEELGEDKRLRSLIVPEDVDGLYVTTEGALALNRLLGERGEEAPQGPDEYLPMAISEDHRLCDTCRNALDSAYKSASETGSRPVVTTSMLILSLLEATVGESAVEAVSHQTYFFDFKKDLFTGAKIAEIKNLYFRNGNRRTDPELGGPSSIPETGEPLMTRDVAVLLSAAERLAWATGSVEVSPDHLFGAVLEPDPVSETMGAPERLKEMGLDIDSLGRDFLKYVKESSPDSAQAWEKALSVPLDETRYLPTCNSDIAEGDDKLNIKPEVDALASLVASKRLEPPLSIGLFGDWGSGKSFFIKEIKNRVCWLAGKANNPDSGEEVPFHKKIVQIEFNAWQYSESNLWASLVTHIFNNLKLSVADPEEDQKKRKELVLEKLDRQEKQRDRAEKELEAAEKELKAKASEIRRERNKFDMTREELSEISTKKAIDLMSLTPDVVAPLSDAAELLGIDVSEKSAKEVQEILSQGTMLSSRLNALALSFATSETWRRLVLWAIMAAGAFYFIRYLPDIFPELGIWSAWERAMSVSSKVAGLGGTAALWLLTQLKRANRAVESFSTARERFTSRLSREEEVLRARFQASQVELKRRRADVEDARRKLKRAEMEVKKKREELADLEPDRRFERFINERALSTDYRKELGILSRISEDFKRLSDFIVESNDPLSIDRIILYIDDLDRCPEDKVLKVLEAVHLILAYRLFVVVVAVDSRWIRRSLIRKYGGLIEDKRPHMPGTAEQVGAKAATSEDYLEKIFQVPFWVKPMDDAGCKALVMELLKEDMKEVKAKGGKGTDGGGLDADTGPTGALGSGGVGPPEKPAGEAEAHMAAAIKEEQERWLVRPERMELLSAELKFIEELAPMISRSPRSVKRFVNVYRIMRAGLSRPELNAFLGKRGGPATFPVVLLLLGVLNGSPSLSTELFREIEGQPRGKAFLDFVEDLKTKHKNSERTEWKEFLARMEKLAKTGYFKKMKMETFQEWSSRVARYSFRMEMVREAEKEGPKKKVSKRSGTA